MKTHTLLNLHKLRNKYGHAVFGKIVQKLLALSFRDIGYDHIVERSVEGVDIDVAEKDGGKFAVEVKTTEGQSISLSRDNIRSLKQRARDGYVPIVAALRIAIFENWIISKIPINELSAGQFLIDRLRAYRMNSIENPMRNSFEQVMEKHFEGALKNGQRYLNEQLRHTGIEVRDA